MFKFTRLHLFLLLAVVGLGAGWGGMYTGRRQAATAFNLERARLIEEKIRDRKVLQETLQKTVMEKYQSEIFEIKKDMTRRIISMTESAIKVAKLREKDSTKAEALLSKAESGYEMDDFDNSAGLAVTSHDKAIEALSKTIRGVYTVKKKDTLFKIALEVYNDTSRWIDIWRLNRKKLINYNRTEVGQVLVLPE